ncbi:hypothetical protein [Candidatus Poriferisodalis sp.]|uniref:phospholipase D family protein n=1 Tax=Candidatus Poriferisodalis sp. TaxID=3101277 RepID=UPI003B020062
MSASGGRAAAGVIDDFLRRHPQGELLVGTGYGSAFGLGWLHQRTRRRPVRLLIGDLRTGFDRWSDDDRKDALAFLAREDVSVRGCHSPDGMLHSKVWVALDPAGTGQPSGVLVGSANLTRTGLFKNDETVARAAPEEHSRIRDDLAQSFQRSWDAKGELMIRLGQNASDIGPLPRPARGLRPALNSGCRAAAIKLAVLAAAGLLLLFALFVVLPWLAGLVVDGSSRIFDTSQDGAEAAGTTISETIPPPAQSGETEVVAAPVVSQAEEGETAAVTAPVLSQPEEGEVAVVTAPVVSQPERDEVADVTQPVVGEAKAADQPTPSATTPAVQLPEQTCPYALPDGSDACETLEGFGGIEAVPCDSLPLDARPLRLVGEENPAGYVAAHDAPELVCTWIGGGTYVAGETIHAGDLRAMNATVWGTGACQFEVFDESGAMVASRADYEYAGWISYALLRLNPGTTIRTDGCGWVPAEYAGLARATDGVIKAANHTGRSYPLIVGVDVPPGNVRIECDFWAWPNAEPDEHGSWADALPRAVDDRRVPGPYRAESGIIWPKC